ncbi:MAG: YajQ family cyclic di-GMP-binding protein [Ignavibacteria bacterium]|nr:YajQ family cyclic di-GMP-binding protein [Ignavibacteria bacterium]
MASQHSFDIVSNIDMQEVDNAFHQTQKEMQTRYDFKGAKSTIELKPKERQIVIHADDDFKRKAIVDMLQTKLIKRGVSIKALQYGTVEDASGGTQRQTITLQSGIEKDNARMIVKMIKDTKRKVQAAIQDDQVRVTGAKIDDLQATMQTIREADLSFDVQFVNYR